MKGHYLIISRAEVDWKKSVQLKYDMYANTYDILYREEQWGKYSSIKPLIRPNARILLDAGCATGLLYEYLLQVTPSSLHTYIGVDISLEMVKKAKLKFTMDPKVDFINADAEYMPLKDNSIDVALSITVFNNLYDVERGLRELLRVVRHDGIVVVTIFKRDENTPLMVRKLKDKLRLIESESKDYILVYNGKANN